MNWLWKGRAWVFGDDIPNDEGLMPLALTRKQEYDPAVLAKHCFEQLNTEFAPNAKPNDFVVAGKNFAYGNPHIQGFFGLKGLGVGILCESMPRGPLRACVNAGVPILVIPELAGFAKDGDTLVVDFGAGLLKNETQGTELKSEPLPEVMREIIGAGGGIGYMKKRLGIAA
jgi:3-isopropylmalate/(R)-2-methylmalate dehydratase small subunit